MAAAVVVSSAPLVPLVEAGPAHVIACVVVIATAAAIVYRYCTSPRVNGVRDGKGGICNYDWNSESTFTDALCVYAGNHAGGCLFVTGPQAGEDCAAGDSCDVWEWSKYRYCWA